MTVVVFWLVSSAVVDIDWAVARISVACEDTVPTTSPILVSKSPHNDSTAPGTLLLLGGRFGLLLYKPFAFNQAVLEDLQTARHVADFVATLGAVDLDRGFTLGKRSNRVHGNPQRLGDATHDHERGQKRDDQNDAG